MDQMNPVLFDYVLNRLCLELFVFRGPVISLDVAFKDIFRKCESLVVPGKPDVRC
jgi:hypothetical protein